MASASLELTGVATFVWALGPVEPGSALLHTFTPVCVCSVGSGSTRVCGGGGVAPCWNRRRNLDSTTYKLVASASFLASLNFSFLSCNVWMILLHKIVVRLQRILNSVGHVISTQYISFPLFPSLSLEWFMGLSEVRDSGEEIFCLFKMNFDIRILKRVLGFPLWFLSLTSLRQNESQWYFLWV